MAVSVATSGGDLLLWHVGCAEVCENDLVLALSVSFLRPKLQALSATNGADLKLMTKLCVYGNTYGSSSSCLLLSSLAEGGEGSCRSPASLIALGHVS